MTTLPEPSDDDLVQRLQRSRRLEDAPRALIDRALALWSTSPPLPTWAALGRAAVRRVVASLVVDSGYRSASAPLVRSADGAARAILFHTDDGDIDLRISPCGDGSSDWMLDGQLLGPTSAGEVHVGVASLTQHLPLSEQGEFHGGPLPSGCWQVVLALDALAIELPPIEVPAQKAA